MSREAGGSERLRARPLCGQHRQRKREEPRDTHRAVAAGRVRHARRKRLPRCRDCAGASLKVALGRGRGCRPLPPTASPLALDAASCRHSPGGPQPAHRFPAPGRKSGPNPGCSARERRGRGGPGIFPVGGDSGPAGIQQLAAPRGAGGNCAALRAGARGKGCGGGWAPERLMINARRWGKRAAPPCQPCWERAEALRSGAGSLFRDTKRHVVGVTLVSQT